MVGTASLEQQLNRVADRLATEYADRFGADAVRRLVAEHGRGLADAPVTQFVAVLVDRAVRKQLGQLRRSA